MTGFRPLSEWPYRPLLNTAKIPTGGSSSKTVMGHWPIESSNLSLSATAFWRGLRAVACIRNLVLGTGFSYFQDRAAGSKEAATHLLSAGELVPLGGRKRAGATPAASSAAKTAPAEVPTRQSASRGSQPVTRLSAARAPAIHAPPRTPPAPRTIPTRGRRRRACRRPSSCAVAVWATFLFGAKLSPGSARGNGRFDPIASPDPEASATSPRPACVALSTKSSQPRRDAFVGGC